MRALLLPIFLGAVFGCQPTTDVAVQPQSTKPETPPRVLVVDDGPLAESLARTWTSMFETTLDVKQATRAEVAKAKRLPADVVIFPAALLGDLANADRLSRLPEESWNDSEWNRDDLFDAVRKKELIWGRNPIGVSLGHPQLVLWRRIDGVPETWKDWADEAVELGKGDDAKDRPPPVLVPLADGAAWISFLTVAAGYVTQRDQLSTLFDLRTLEPRIDLPPFVRALTELKAACRAQGVPPVMTVAEVHAAFLRGEARSALAWPSGAVVETKSPARVAPLPGVKEVYSWSEKTWQPTANMQPVRVPLVGATGVIAAVTADAKRPKQAARLLTWLSGREASARIAGPQLGLTLFRQSQVATPERWCGAGMPPDVAQQYSEIVRDAQSSSLALFVPRLPRWSEYSAALDKAVRQAVVDDADPQEALTEAAETWRKITADAGPETQRRANERALGFAE